MTGHAFCHDHAASTYADDQCGRVILLDHTHKLCARGFEFMLTQNAQRGAEPRPPRLRSIEHQVSLRGLQGMLRNRAMSRLSNAKAAPTLRRCDHKLLKGQIKK